MADDIKQTYDLDAGAERVFAELTEPERLDRWWTTRSKSDPKQGGAFEYEWEFEDSGRNGRQSGAYKEVVSGKRLSYPWDGGGFETTVEFTIESSGDGSKLHLVHSGWDAGTDETRAQIAQAWEFFLGNLKSYLADGTDNRTQVLGQKVNA